MLIWDVSYLQHGTISPYADQFAQWLCNAKQYFVDEEHEESGLPLAADLSTAEMLLYSHKGKEKGHTYWIRGGSAQFNISSTICDWSIPYWFNQHALL